LPRDIFGKAELKAFGVKQSLTIDATEDHWILDWSLEDSENYDRFAEDDGRGWMGRLVPLRNEDQQAAATAMLKHDTGVLCAPTAFGKTVTAAALIASRGVKTLVLVHRTELLRQWKEQLQSLLGVGPDVIGSIGGGKAKPTGRIDVAVMQFLLGEANDRARSAPWLRATAMSSSTSATTCRPSRSKRS
jgi:superfamily II DNA or RNA helicase